jgi:hypothetical protein
MSEQSLIKRLYIKLGYKIAIVNAPEGYRNALGELEEGVELSDNLNGEYDLVQVFLNSRADLEQMGLAAIAAVKHNGTLWFAYPKKSSKVKTDINRDSGWEMVTAAGWGGVRQISIDDTWSALQFKPEGQVKRRGSM